MTWKVTPRIVVVGAEGDARIELVRDAVAYWNQLLQQAGSPFRLPDPVHDVQPVPEDALRAMSQAILDGSWRRAPVPAALHGLRGELIVVLGETDFASFASPFFDGGAKRVIGLREMRTPPMNLPNVARNVVAHEIGHAIGFVHNADPGLLMCGRPAPCRPPLFALPEPRYFPLSDDEMRQLLSMYPAALPQRQP